MQTLIQPCLTENMTKDTPHKQTHIIIGEYENYADRGQPFEVCIVSGQLHTDAVISISCQSTCLKAAVAIDEIHLTYHSPEPRDDGKYVSIKIMNVNDKQVTIEVTIWIAVPY